MANSPMLLLLCCLAVGASALQLERPAADCLSPAVTTLNFNFFPQRYQLQSISRSVPTGSGFSTTVDFAEDFSVEYRGTYKVVVNKRVNETYVLYQCGTPNPMDALNTEGSLPANAKVFQIPLVSVAVTDSSAAGFLAELGVIDRVAFSSKYSYSPCLQAIHACGDEAVSASEPYDYDPSPANDADFNKSVAAWKEASLAQSEEVDAIFSSGASTNKQSIAVTSFADPGVLNRAEWVKFVAVFFNKEVEAERLFSNITRVYQQLNSTARAAAADKATPTKVAWISKFGDTISVNFATYKRQYMEDAGGTLPTPESLVAAGAKKQEGMYSTVNYNFNASVAAEKQGFIGIVKKVDVLFDDSYSFGTGNLEDMAAFVKFYDLAGVQDDIPAIANGKVLSFNNRLSAKQADGSVGSDWFEGSVARPDLVLADFVKVITPPAAAANTPMNWLRQLPTAASNAGALSFTSPDSCSAVVTAAGSPDRCKRAEPTCICPNAYRDCSTGELKAVEDPNARCEAATACPEPTTNTNINTTMNYAGATLLSQLVLTLLCLAALVLVL